MDGFGPCTRFDRKTAEEIIAFIDENRNLPGEQTLHVNCMVGKSRSGAIATFACWYLGLNLEEFKNANIQIVPNLHILNTLMSVLQERYEPGGALKKVSA
jgi:protein-tyrosine phosphatase